MSLTEYFLIGSFFFLIIFLIIISRLVYYLAKFLNRKNQENKKTKDLQSRIRETMEFKKLYGIDFENDPNQRHYICPRCNIFAKKDTNICPKCGNKL